MEMSTMLASIVLFMFFFSPSTAFENWSKVGLKLLSTKRIRSNLEGRGVADRKGPDDLGCLKYIEIYIYNNIYICIIFIIIYIYIQYIYIYTIYIYINE